MTNEDKNLLIVDLCARLPYKVMIQIEDNIAQLTSVLFDNTIVYAEYSIDNAYSSKAIEHIKPYLFPMSSMTEKQYKEYSEILDNELQFNWNVGNYVEHEYIDWLNKHHFDYRDLIDKKLAIDASNLNIYEDN